MRVNHRRAGVLHQVKGAHDQPGHAAGFEIGTIDGADNAARRVREKDREFERPVREGKRGCKFR